MACPNSFLMAFKLTSPDGISKLDSAAYTSKN
jgi:hypothetical protein